MQPQKTQTPSQRIQTLLERNPAPPPAVAAPLVEKAQTELWIAGVATVITGLFSASSLFRFIRSVRKTDHKVWDPAERRYWLVRLGTSAALWTLLFLLALFWTIRVNKQVNAVETASGLAEPEPY